jgi:uncharacterized protein (DUF427 family)
MNKPTESVWDYPRPPRLEHSTEHIVVTHRGRVVADTTGAIRILETSHPPTYYLPPSDVDLTLLEPVAGSTWCEFKGAASYADLVMEGQRLPRAVWWYEEPSPAYRELMGYLALYPGRVDQCTINGEVVRSQEGDFYGGWITDRITGPFKGAPGTLGW